MSDFQQLKFRTRVKRLSCLSIGALVMTAGLTAATGTGIAAAHGKKLHHKTPAAMVTAKARKLGTLKDGITPYPDADFLAKNGKTWTGWEVQLTNIVAKMLHLRVKYVAASVTADVPGVQAGRWQLSTDDWFVTPAREKIVNFVTDLRSGTRFFEAKGSKLKVNSPTDLCGHTVAVKKATVEATLAQKAATACTKSGKPKLTIQLYPTEAAVTLAIQSHRAQVGWTGSTPTDYLVKQQPNKFQVAGSNFTVVTVGIVVSKKYPGLANAMAAAVNQLIKNGRYEKLLKKWGNATGKIHHSVVKK
jgi:polar amino acid transport system substrate-binding protein